MANPEQNKSSVDDLRMNEIQLNDSLKKLDKFINNGTENLSYSEYKEEYDVIRNSLIEISKKLGIMQVPSELEGKFNTIVNLQKQLAEKMRNIQTADQLKKERKIKETPGLTAKSGFSDITLTPQEIGNIEPKEYLTFSGNNHFYLVTAGGKDYILRIVENNNSKEVALLLIEGGEKDPNKLTSILKASEGGLQFQDIEIQGSWTKNLTGENGWSNTGAGVAGAAAGYVALKATAKIVAKTAAKSIAKKLALGAIPAAGTAAAIGLTAAEVTALSLDLDLTTERATSLGLKQKLDNLKSYYPTNK